MEKLASIKFFDQKVEANFGKITKTNSEKLSQFANNVYSIKMNVGITGVLDADSKIHVMLLDADKALLSREVIVVGAADSNTVVQKEFNVVNPSFVAYIDCSLMLANNTTDANIKVEGDLYDYLTPVNTYDVVAAAPKTATFIVTGNGSAGGAMISTAVSLIDAKNAKLNGDYLTGLSIVDAVTNALDAVDTVAVSVGSVHKTITANSELVVINDEDGELVIDLTNALAKDVKIMLELKTGEVLFSEVISWV